MTVAQPQTPTYTLTLPNGQTYESTNKNFLEQKQDAYDKTAQNVITSLNDSARRIGSDQRWIYDENRNVIPIKAQYTTIEQKPLATYNEQQMLERAGVIAQKNIYTPYEQIMIQAAKDEARRNQDSAWFFTPFHETANTIS